MWIRPICNSLVKDTFFKNTNHLKITHSEALGSVHACLPIVNCHLDVLMFGWCVVGLFYAPQTSSSYKTTRSLSWDAHMLSTCLHTHPTIARSQFVVLCRICIRRREKSTNEFVSILYDRSRILKRGPQSERGVKLFLQKKKDEYISLLMIFAKGPTDQLFFEHEINLVP